MGRATFEVRLLDRESPVQVDVTVDKDGFGTAEEVARTLAASVLEVKPASLELFALKSGSIYLYPCQKLTPGSDGCHLELRIRFRVPTASKLLKVDPNSFIYFYRQTCADFKSGLVLLSDHQPRVAPPTRYFCGRFRLF
jgi:hypothetical protein